MADKQKKILIGKLTSPVPAKETKTPVFITVSLQKYKVFIAFNF